MAAFFYGPTPDYEKISCTTARLYVFMPYEQIDQHFRRKGSTTDPPLVKQGRTDRYAAFALNISAS